MATYASTSQPRTEERGPRKSVRRTSVTMRDVARLAGVSQSTVSRVLSGATDSIPIGEETRRRVVEAVEQLGYQPNLHAGSLRGQKTHLLAVMIADLSNPFYHPMVRAVQDVARAHSYDVLVANTDHTREGEEHFCRSVVRRPVDGVLIVPYHLTDVEIDDFIRRTGAAVAVVGQHIRHPLADVAFGDDGMATYHAVTWLINERGHTRLGFIGVDDNFSAASRRRRAFEQALAHARITRCEGDEQLGDWSPESGFDAMNRLLDREQPPSAVFACNDLMAIGAMEAVRRRSLRIPQDVAIVGFDDIPPASWVRPRLTTIGQHPGQMGSVLANALFERIQGDYDGPARRFEIPCVFIERESA